MRQLQRGSLHMAMLLATAMAPSALAQEQQTIHGKQDEASTIQWTGRRSVVYSPNRKSGAAALKRASRKARNIKGRSRASRGR